MADCVKNQFYPFLSSPGDDQGALEDFKCAAHLGNEFAKQMLVALNPYAALCNQMLSEVMTKLRAGESTQWLVGSSFWDRNLISGSGQGLHSQHRFPTHSS